MKKQRGAHPTLHLHTGRVRACLVRWGITVTAGSHSNVVVCLRVRSSRSTVVSKEEIEVGDPPSVVALSPYWSFGCPCQRLVSHCLLCT